MKTAALGLAGVIGVALASFGGATEIPENVAYCAVNDGNYTAAIIDTATGAPRADEQGNAMIDTGEGPAGFTVNEKGGYCETMLGGEPVRYKILEM